MQTLPLFTFEKSIALIEIFIDFVSKRFWFIEIMFAHANIYLLLNINFVLI